MNPKNLAALILAFFGAAIGLVAGLWLLKPSHVDLQIVSNPPGASIYLNQKFEGVTPKSLAGIPIGEHRLRLALAGYHDENRAIDVENGKSTIELNLKPLPPKGTLIVESRPPGAFVWLNGERGPQTPARFNASVGTHVIKVEKPGFLPQEETVEIKGNDEKQISVKLVSVKVAYYRDAIKREPDNTTNYVELGRLYIRAGDLESGFQTLLEAVQAFGRRGSALDKGFGELLTAIRNTQPDFDKKQWQELIQGVKNALFSPKSTHNSARIAYEFFSKIEQWKEVENLATYFIEHGKYKSHYYRWRMMARANLGMDEEVMQDVEALVAAMTEPEQKAAFDIHLYWALKHLQRWKELRRICSAYAEWQPKAIAPQLYRLEAIGRLGDDETFTTEFHRLLDLFRTDPVTSGSYRNFLRPALLKLERWSEMAEVCSILYSSQPDVLEARFWYLEAMIRMGNWKAALQAYEGTVDGKFLATQQQAQLEKMYDKSLYAILFAGAWAMMELGETDKLEKLLNQYEGDAHNHFWVTTIQGEQWRRHPTAEPAKPTLEAKRCASPPNIDGRLNDESWAGAGGSSSFYDLDHPRKNENQTKLQAIWDDTHLYIGITGRGQNREGRHPVALDLYPNRRLELFLDTNTDYTTYKQFMFNVKGQIAHFDCVKGAFDRGNGFTEAWHPKFKMAVTGEGEDHVYELAIPFSSLGVSTPKPGSVWGMNLIYLGTNSVTFAPLGAAFHQPLRFGFLVLR